MTRLALLSSPLLGPAAWAPLAAALERRGLDVLVSTVPDRPVRTPADVLAGFLADLVPSDGDPVVLVPHSNAGLFVAALADRVAVAGTVFLDAGLPEAAPTTPMTTPGFLAHLEALPPAGEGLLPPWRDWWPGEDTSSLFPDATTRAAVEAEQPLLPLAYFADRVPSPPAWSALPAAYVSYGEVYAEEHAVAVARGWPAYRLAGDHLHHLVAPEEVAGTVVAALRRLGLVARPGG